MGKNLKPKKSKELQKFKTQEIQKTPKNYGPKDTTKTPYKKSVSTTFN